MFTSLLFSGQLDSKNQILIIKLNKTTFISYGIQDQLNLSRQKSSPIKLLAG